MYRLEIDRKVLKELKKFPKSDLEKIFNKLEALKENPRPVGYVPVQGTNFYRIRFGDYRIIYEIIDKKLFIGVVKIDTRGNVYKKK